MSGMGDLVAIVRRWGVTALALFVIATGCSRQATPTPTPAATPLPPVGVQSSATVSASGQVTPVRDAELSFAAPGRVQTVSVAVNDEVAAGTVLIELEAAAAEASLVQAQAALLRAQAHLNELRSGPRPQEIAAAEARLTAAQAHLAQLTEGSRPEEIAAAEANLAAAQARHDTLYAEPNAAVVAAAWAEVEQARAALARLRHPATASQIAEAEAQVQSAQAELDLLTAGARPEEVAAAEAAVAEAEATVKRAEADLAGFQLRAPFTGTVTAVEVSPGEMVQAGEVVLVLADLSQMQVELTDLSERAVARVSVGQAAEVFVEALGAEIPGRVARVAPRATLIGGDVVYPVIIELEQQPAGLRWGMSVDAEIVVE